MEFGVEDVVKLGDGRAESFGEILTRELGQVAESVEAPQGKKFQVRRSKFQERQCLGEIEWQLVERFLWNITEGWAGVRGTAPARMRASKNEAVGGVWREREEMGDVGGGAGGEVGGQAELADAGVPSVECRVIPLRQGYGGRGGGSLRCVAASRRNDGLPRAGAATDVEDEGVGSGEFEVGSEGFGELEKVAQRLGFGVGIAREDE